MSGRVKKYVLLIEIIIGIEFWSIIDPFWICLRGQSPMAQGTRHKAQGTNGFTSREVAQFILELDATITLWRQTTYAPRRPRRMIAPHG